MKTYPNFFHLTAMSMLFAGTASVMAADFYVSTSGSDTNSGTIEKPFRSIAQAQLKVRAVLGKEPVTVHLRGGTYYLNDTIVFTAADSGSKDAPVRYAAYQGEEVVVSGGIKLDLDWKPYQGGILQAKVSVKSEIDQLFVNGTRQHMARYPNYDPNVLVYNGHSADAFSPERAVKWSNPEGGYIHGIHKARWGGYHYRITGKNDDNTIAYEGGWQNNRAGKKMHKTQRFVENIFEELDAPGEWFYEEETQTLYFYPPAGVDVRKATFVTARLSELFEFRGTQQAPVRLIDLAGMTLRHTARTFMETKEPLLRSDWTIYRGGAVLLTGAEDCQILDCEFDQVGGNAVFVSKYNRRVAVRGTHIHGAGGSGVAFVGSPDAVRDPLFNYKERMAYADIDKTAGPKTDEYPADCLVEDSLIHNIGVVEKQAAGVQIAMAKNITVRHVSIYETSRAGLNVSEGAFGGHIIEYCDVFDTVLETSDHGSFNAWGRDRFWQLEGAPDKELAELALLDTVEPIIIRNSRWRCEHGWDIDLDDGATNYEIYNNLMLYGGLKLREGFHRKFYNNIAVNSTMHPHAWYNNSKSQVTGNIWMTAYAPAAMKEKAQFNSVVDRNLFMDEADQKAFAEHGWDLNSVYGDPMFVDPAKGDYRVKEGSPAFKIGFKNFPMDKFGVQKPELKAIARVPSFPIPKIIKTISPSELAALSSWMGARVQALTGEAYSAFGVAKEDGGIHLVSVPVLSGAAKSGLKEGDVIQKINNQTTKTIADLEKISEASKGTPITIILVRGQQEISINL